MIKIIVITHGALGAELVKTAETIVGKQEETVVIGLGQGDSLATLTARISGEVSRISENDGALVLTDMLGGTPCNACLPLCRDNKIEVVTGVNLYMLISAFMNRKTDPLPELAQKAVSDGKKNIANAKEIFLKKLQ